MKNKELEIINKLGGKLVNIYLNDETLILKEMFKKNLIKNQIDQKFIKIFFKIFRRKNFIRS